MGMALGRKGQSAGAHGSSCRGGLGWANANAGAAQVGPINVGAQLLARHQPAGGPFDVDAPVGRNSAVSVFPLTYRWFRHAQLGCKQLGAALGLQILTKFHGANLYRFANGCQYLIANSLG